MSLLQAAKQIDEAIVTLELVLKDGAEYGNWPLNKNCEDGLKAITALRQAILSAEQQTAQAEQQEPVALTQDEIIRMALEAGALVFQSSFCGSSFDFNSEQLERFAALVAAHERERVINEPLTKEMWSRFESEIRADEREACAKVCEEMWAGGYGPSAITAVIRSRSSEQ